MSFSTHHGNVFNGQAHLTNTWIRDIAHSNTDDYTQGSLNRLYSLSRTVVDVMAGVLKMSVGLPPAGRGAVCLTCKEICSGFQPHSWSRSHPLHDGVRQLDIVSRRDPMSRIISSPQHSQSTVRCATSSPGRCSTGSAARTSSSPKKGVARSAYPEQAPTQAAVQDSHAEAHPDVYQTSRLVHGNRPEGRLLSCLAFGRAYQYRVLPFGLSLSPRVFTKTMEAAFTPLGDRDAVSGPPETFRGSWVHGIFGGGGPPRVDANATAPTLATETGSLESVAHRQQAYGHHAFLPTHPDPLVFNDLLADRVPLEQGQGQARAGPAGQHSCRGVINRQGGIRSWQLTRLARRLLLWSQQVISSLRATHIPGDLNQTADALSHQSTPRGEWPLHPRAVQLIWEQFGQAQVDLLPPWTPPISALVLPDLGTPRDRYPSAQLAAGGRGTLRHPRQTPGTSMSGQDEEILSGPPPALVVTSLRLGPRPLGSYTPISGASSHPGALLGEKTRGVARSGTGCPFLRRDWRVTSPPSTLGVYVAATAAHHDPVAGKPLGQHDLVIRRRASRGPPLEPLGAAALFHLTIKTALLMALTSKRVGDLQAPSVSTDCLELGPGDSHVILRPRPGYVPKGPTTPPRDQVVNLQALPTGEEDPTTSVLCPVRALRLYLDRTQSFRSSEQLFVCFGGQQKGRTVSKQRLAHWNVDSDATAYRSQDRPCPLGGWTHSTRGVASSWALAQGASLADITFTRSRRTFPLNIFGGAVGSKLQWPWRLVHQSLFTRWPPVHKMAASPETVHKNAASPEPVHKFAATPEPPAVMDATLEVRWTQY
ncbi:hypothetical protein IRJ41_025374 [Triplophysa rosa]|uniref:Uncharacterized protein n=1 Tax=Triplophysa rosa TaxID=992332 RepID=A0A9W7T793_TRIRA|nr:hypothetical protein IRJ41_025374 [Triplophysa rosa]